MKNTRIILFLVACLIQSVISHGQTDSSRKASSEAHGKYAGNSGIKTFNSAGSYSIHSIRNFFLQPSKIKFDLPTGSFNEVNIIDNTTPTVGPELSFQGYRQSWRMGVDVSNHGGSEDLVLAAADVPGVGVRDLIYMNANKTGDNTINDNSSDPTLGVFLTPTVSNVQSTFSVSDRHPDRTIVGIRSSQYTTSNGNYLGVYTSATMSTPVFGLDNSLEFFPFLKSRGSIHVLSKDINNPSYLELNANPSDQSTDFKIRNYYNPANGYSLQITDPSNYNYLVINNKSRMICIGCSNPTSPLTVSGMVESLGVKVNNVSTWGDDVFDKRYELPALADIELYIHKHGHLPGIPSEAEVKKTGLDLVINQVQLLKKVEELTLYVIEQNKKIELLEQQNSRITELEKKIDALTKKAGL